MQPFIIVVELDKQIFSQRQVFHFQPQFYRYADRSYIFRIIGLSELLARHQCQRRQNKNNRIFLHNLFFIR